MQPNGKPYVLLILPNLLPNIPDHNKMSFISVVCCMQYWSDQRDAVKQKAQELNLFHGRGTGGGPPTEQLTDYQQRVLTCMGGWKRVFGFTVVKDPLEVCIIA